MNSKVHRPREAAPYESSPKEPTGRLAQLESLLLPVVLLFTGLILIGGDRVGILSLDRIQNLWPVALILIGLSDLLTASDEPSRRSRTGVRGA